MLIPLLVIAIIGLLIYALTAGKISTIGLVLFACATLALCLQHDVSSFGIRIR